MRQKKDLLHAIIATIGGILRSEVKESFCRLKVNIDVQKPLCRGIFISMVTQECKWLPFKYESLPFFALDVDVLGMVLKIALK